LKNALTPKLLVKEQQFYFNDNLTKWQIDQIASLQNPKLMK
jgi:hypothetical protein